ncbi:glycosyltransferase family 39 protein [Paenibacillus eucommiae]|uniref:Glycosyltransferase RgtA/B/C/D-like domain-containing protein n=1 Tax=Paenibacillus eucommiae TaxID=1355755 RepID=A0ABS4IRS1_9BACL|nr:glycosyltransferase family 39 protein [Paenibacillus eucommiae]MBP1990273.1 hypothetical protein [Paenibacillus eucommiae]
MDKLQKSGWMASKLLACFGIIFFGVTFVSTFVNMFFVNASVSKMLGALFVVYAVLLALVHVVTAYMSRRLFLVLLMAAAVVLRVVWILMIDTPPVSDFAVMHDTALRLAGGDFSVGHAEYFTNWTYQLGFTVYEALMIKLFGDPIIILKIANIVFSAATIYVIYLTAAKVFNEFCGRVSALLFAFYIPNIVMCSVLTNQHLSVFLFFLGCYFILHKGMTAKYNWIFIGICFALGNVIRPLGSFFIVGFVVYVVLIQLVPFGKTLFKQKQARSILQKMVGVVAVFFVVQQLVNFSFIYAGITDYKLSNREPYWKFMVGLNAETNGTWSSEDSEYARPFKVGAERDAAELEVIKERLADKSQVAALFVRKLAIFWGSEDASVFWSVWDMDKPTLAFTLKLVERVTYFLMAGFAIITFLGLIRRKDPELNNQAYMLFLILLLGYAAVHLVIEIQTRYRLDIMPAFIILQSFGLYVVYKRLGLKRQTQ